LAKGAGRDVPPQFITVGVRCRLDTGNRFAEVRTFGTMTRDLWAWADYLEALGVTQGALQSTGVLWKPVWNSLDGRFRLLLVNPRQVQQVPGRNSDVSAAEGIAQLLQCGLLRELRDLTRLRAQLVSEQTRLANRLHKVLEDANIQLAAVATDILGQSGRALLRALIRGEHDPEERAELAAGRLPAKIPAWKLAWEGHFTEHHRFLVDQLLGHLDELEQRVDELRARIADRWRPLLDDAQLKRLDAIPGVNRTTVENVVAAIGGDLAVFPDETHLSSWAGIGPGNEQSAGKQLRSHATRKHRWLRRAVVEAARAASHTQNSYGGAQDRRLAPRRGKKRALLAVGHSLLVIIYHRLKYDVEYRDLGVDSFDKREPERLRRSLVQRLERLGYRVTLAPQDEAA
jgi:transposase